MQINDPLICNSCGKVYLTGDIDGLCDEPRCQGALLDTLLGFVSYRRHCETYRGIEANDLAVRIKDRVERVLHARQVGGGLFIDKTGIEREDFEKKIAKTIQACSGRVFLLVLTPGALDLRENRGEDWLRKEIRLAIEYGMEIIPILASKYRQDKDFEWPERLPPEIAVIQKENVNLSFIGDLDERYLVDATHHIAGEIIRSIENNRIMATRTLAKPNRDQQSSIPVRLRVDSFDSWKATVSKKMVSIPSGSYLMGSEVGSASEKPIHHVEISEFFMMKCLVTQRDFERVVGRNPSNFIGDSNRPIEGVSWFDAIVFCNRWSEADGLEPVYEINEGQVELHFEKNGYRLPTEAEWEYACRANGPHEFFWGKDEKLAAAYCWFDSNSEDVTHSVGTKKKNPFNLYDMCGNVWEWTQDWFGAEYYEDSEACDPRGPEFGEHKVLRGGCWFNGVNRLRCGSRLKRLPNLVDDVTGFRCVSRHPELLAKQSK
jgi:formylglycine-generating enzyme required for sulfatase activity